MNGSTHHPQTTKSKFKYAGGNIMVLDVLCPFSIGSTWPHPRLLSAHYASVFIRFFPYGYLLFLVPAPEQVRSGLSRDYMCRKRTAVHRLAVGTGQIRWFSMR
ncbi:hypothetical protein CHARACLAT_028759 [Characodon lateralis]|uniref:Uncharacterized protein n=1 Tax=Characodon lateralis TaxID=208331 RepID=A0ABU7E7M9_9TELE|nr:hypothetical protein [Characodon lateralis]